jgi:hypothetical protein
LKIFDVVHNKRTSDDGDDDDESKKYWAVEDYYISEVIPYKRLLLTPAIVLMTFFWT